MRKHSFTMLEMVMVLLIITIVALLAVRNFRPSGNSAQTHGNQLLDVLSVAHNRAMNSGSTMEIFWDKAIHAWRFEERSIPVPAEITVQIAGEVPEADYAVFAFYPDGGARAVRVTLEAPDAVAEVRCYPISGTAELISGENAETPGEQEIQPLWLKENAL